MVAFGPGDPWASGRSRCPTTAPWSRSPPSCPAGSARRAVVYEDGQGFSDLGTAENSQVRLSADGRYVAADDVVHDRQSATATPLVAGGPGTDVVIAMSSTAGTSCSPPTGSAWSRPTRHSADDLYVKDTQVTSGYRLCDRGWRLPTGSSRPAGGRQLAPQPVRAP